MRGNHLAESRAQIGAVERPDRDSLVSVVRASPSPSRMEVSRKPSWTEGNTRTKPLHFVTNFVEFAAQTCPVSILDMRETRLGAILVVDFGEHRAYFQSRHRPRLPLLSPVLVAPFV